MRCDPPEEQSNVSYVSWQTGTASTSWLHSSFGDKFLTSKASRSGASSAVWMKRDGWSRNWELSWDKQSLQPSVSPYCCGCSVTKWKKSHKTVTGFLRLNKKKTLFFVILCQIFFSQKCCCTESDVILCSHFLWLLSWNVLLKPFIICKNLNRFS